MATKIRLARAGSKKRPFYRIVVSNSRAPRDGDFIEKVGTYDPLLSKDNQTRIVMKLDRISYWLSIGAKPTDKVAAFIVKSGIEIPDYLKKELAIKQSSRKPKAPKKEAA